MEYGDGGSSSLYSGGSVYTAGSLVTGDDDALKLENLE